MPNFWIGYIPLLIAILLMVLRVNYRKRFAFLHAVLVYIVFAIIGALSIGVTVLFKIDPQDLPAAITPVENILLTILVVITSLIFVAPIIAIFYWLYTWWKFRNLEKNLRHSPTQIL